MCIRNLLFSLGFKNDFEISPLRQQGGVLTNRQFVEKVAPVPQSLSSGY
jgi:hypothetical protein